jgi:hypothetical protein
MSEEAYQRPASAARHSMFMADLLPARPLHAIDGASYQHLRLQDILTLPDLNLAWDLSPSTIGFTRAMRTLYG